MPIRRRKRRDEAELAARGASQAGGAGPPAAPAPVLDAWPLQDPPLPPAPSTTPESADPPAYAGAPAPSDAAALPPMHVREARDRLALAVQELELSPVPPSLRTAALIAPLTTDDVASGTAAPAPGGTAPEAEPAAPAGSWPAPPPAPAPAPAEPAAAEQAPPSPVVPGGLPGGPTRLALYRSMSEMRQFEKRAYDLFLQGLVKGTSHLGLGQEAISAAFGEAMRPDDYTFATYRGHNHTLARGVAMTPVMGELMGRACGLMGGKGGSMHLTSAEHNMLGSYAIIGAHLTIANGAAWSARYRGTEQVAVCFFGDGTTNIGAFHEALNLAAVWKLPVVFVCENNLYMEYTPISDVTPVQHPAADRASAYGLAPIVVDGNDVVAVYEVALAALARARRGEGPSLVEAKTYRHGGHSRADPGKYRPDAELAAWMARDPLVSYRERLLAAGTAATELDGIDAAVAAEVDRATEEAKASPPSDAGLILQDVWSDGGSTWRN